MFVWLARLPSAALGWPCVKCAGRQHVGRFRQQSLAPPHPAQPPPQQEAAKRPARTMPREWLNSPGQIYSPSLLSTCLTLFLRICLEKFFREKLVIKRGPWADTPPLSERLLLMSGKSLGLWWRNQRSKIWHHGGGGVWGGALGLWLCCSPLSNTVKSAERFSLACKRLRICLLCLRCTRAFSIAQHSLHHPLR